MEIEVECPYCGKRFDYEVEPPERDEP